MEKLVQGFSNNEFSLTLQSDKSKQLHKMVTRIAPSEANILIQGEIGTGKSSWAKEIHNYSNRKISPFISVDCGAIHYQALSDELFGVVQNPIARARPIKRIGLIECANGGTLFLKNVNKLNDKLQEKLFNFLTSRTFSRNGEKKVLTSNVRIISSCCGQLEDYVIKGEFREDLFYRLNTIQIAIPSLFQRKEDIPEILFKVMNSLTKNQKKNFSSEAIQYLTQYRWNGNLHELKNVCLQSSLNSEDTIISINDLPERVRNPQASKIELEFDQSVPLYEVEKKYILKALDYYKGNKTQAAQALGITIKTLYNKLHEYGEFEKFSDSSNNIRSIK